MSAAPSPDREDRLVARSSPGLSGSIAVPGDKSMSHRALILGGLAEGTTEIEGLLEGDDVLHTAAAVRVLGAAVVRKGEGVWSVTGASWQSPPRPIDCGNSGTGARLLMGAAAAFPIKVRFTGDASLSSRPMNRVLDPLRAMGARASSADGGQLPVEIEGGGVGGICFLNSKASAQVKSAILLAGLGSDADVAVVEPSPSRDHSENMLRTFGCDVEVTEGVEGRVARLGHNRRLRATRVAIPGDPSSAAFPIVAALITRGSDLTVRAVMMNPLRTGLFVTLREMGADLSFENRRAVGGEDVADVRARYGPLRGIEVPASRTPSMIDEYPILAVAAAFAEGRTVMHGLAELRVKESDRLAAIIDGLRQCGVDACDDGDSLTVEGNGSCPAGGASIAAHHDHRIAMSFLVLGLAAREPVETDSGGMIATSFPGFVDLMCSTGADIA